ncbi:hypothetical protein ILYODFUR_038467 [Ilyodon furcidens]|uniref:Uncharacterized protein n=1 Tax=Ilyodon furcidens TaxID=33524 RepID=A0ABV0VA96_9TELE
MYTGYESGAAIMERLCVFRRSVRWLLLLLPLLLLLLSGGEGRESELNYVTCGSLVKLLNTRHNVRLHSHDVKYGSGNRGPEFKKEIWACKAVVMLFNRVKAGFIVGKLLYPQ